MTRVQPDGVATFQGSYSGFTTTCLDENHHLRQPTTDALGRVVSVQEYLGNAFPYTLLTTTTYGYDVADRLTAIRDQAGNQTTISYDSLGRQTNRVDPDRGSWSYQYNPIGTLSHQTDARGQTLSYGYDALDRLTSKTGPGLAVSYAYDDPTGGNAGTGRRTSLTDGAGSASYVYDLRGRLIRRTRVINGTSYSLSTTYDALDRVTSLTYPNGDVLRYGYGDHGLPVSAFLNGAPLVQGATYNALKKLTALPLGNGLTTRWRSYGTGLDDQVSGAPNRWFGLPSQVQTGTVQNQTFVSYDSVGNPTALSYTDHTSESLSFSYNELDQLTQMSGTVSESSSYLQAGYDLGNLMSKGGASFSYPAGGQAHPHAPTTAGAVSYTYDGNGNRSGDGTYTYSDDAENRLTSVSGPVSLQNTFDGDGVRLVRVAQGTTTQYVGDWFEVNPSTGVATVYYPFNGIPIALKQGSSLYYLHRDQVGSVVSISDASAREVASLRFGPFGNLRTLTFANGYSALPTDRLFTGQVRDLGDDRFYFFKSRSDDATIGKFHSPDSVVPNATNPQALNRSAYALNNPLKLVDPSGHDPVDPAQMDPTWVQQFEAAHQGQMPTLPDWRDYQFSLSHPGSGPHGTWTSFDWQSYTYVRRILTPDLVREVGRPDDGGKGVTDIGDIGIGQFANGVPSIAGPDGTRIFLGGTVPHGAAAWTFGNNIIIGQATIDGLSNGSTSMTFYRSLIIHEYVHVLQYRHLGAMGFLGQYVSAGVRGVLDTGQPASFGNRDNALETTAYNVQDVYLHDPGLAVPWTFWQ